MNQITQIALTNFQSHHSTIIKPAPAGQLTVLVGPSDVGKSAIIRSLKWLYYGEPQGADFITVGKKSCSVSITHADAVTHTDHKVERIRDSKTTRHLINGDVYGTGSTAPLEVQQITGVRPVMIGDTAYNLNLAEQLDGPFLGTKSTSAPARARALDKLIGTEEVSNASKELGTDLYRAERNKDRLGKEIVRLKEEIAKYGYLDALKANIDELIGFWTKINDDLGFLNDLRPLAVDYDTVTRNERLVAGELTQLDFIGELTGNIQELDAAIPRMAELINLYEKYIDTCSDMGYLGNDIAYLAEFINGSEKNILQLLYDVPRFEHLSVLNQQYTNTAKEIDKQKDTLIKTSPFVEKVDADALQKDIARWNELKFLRSSLIPIHKSMDAHGLTVSKTSFADAIDADVIKADIEKLINLCEAWAIHKRVKLFQEQRQEEIETAQLEIQNGMAQYEECLIEMGTCPVCGSAPIKFNLEVII